jgi:hypothetical protein
MSRLELLRIWQDGDGVVVKSDNIADVAAGVYHAIAVLVRDDDAPAGLRAIAQQYQANFERWAALEGHAAGMDITIARAGPKV